MTTVDVRDARVQRLYERHYLALVRLAVHLVDDLESAEDTVQDVFTAVAARTLPADDDGALRYLKSAVVNRARSALRRRRVVRAFGLRAAPTGVAEPADEAALRDDRRDRLLALLVRLPGRQREVVVLRYYEDLRVAEIADLLRISPGAVSTSLSRALTTLDAWMEDTDVR